MPNALDDALSAFSDTAESLADTQSTPSYKTPAPQSSIDQSIDDFAMGEDRSKLSESINAGAPSAADQARKLLQLTGKTGLPRDFIERNQSYVEAEAAKQDFNPDRLMKDSPAFASWLAEHPDHVSAAGPDTQNLSYMERQLRYLSSSAESGPLQLEHSDLGMKAFDGTITPAERERQREIELRLDTLGRSGDVNDITGFFEQIPGQVAQQAPIYLRSLEGKVKYGAEGIVLGGAAGAAAGIVTANPALPAVGASIGAFYGWRYGAGVEAGKMEMGEAMLDYEKLKDDQGQPLDSTTTKGLALMAGTINGALEGLTGVEALANKLPGVRNLTRSGIKSMLQTPTARGAVLAMAKQVGDVMLTEGATEALQMYVTKAGGVMAQWAKDGGSPLDVLGKIFTAENATQAIQEARAGAQGGGGVAVGLSTPGLVADLKQVREANKAKQAFESIGKATENTKFAQDLPGPLKDIIARATENGPVENLYVPEHAFTEYFQKEGVDPREVYREITGDVEAYDQSVQTGADLPIKTSDYVQKLAGTKHNAFLASELRVGVDVMNATEADAWIKEQDAAEQAAAEQKDVQTSLVGDPNAQVRQEIAGQLLAAGFAPTVVDQYAALVESRYRTRAERRGLGETAADLFAAHNLSVTRPVPEILQKLGGQTTELDAMLDRLRSGDLPKDETVFGQSLVAFLKEKGGLQDQGGELTTRNVDANRKAFTKKLVQKTGKTLDEAAEIAAAAGYLDSRDINGLLEAIDKETRGTPIYALSQENARAFDTKQNLDSLKAYLDAKNVDLRTATNQEIKALLGEAVQQSLPGEEGETFAQTEQHADAQLALVKEAVREVADGADEGVAPGIRPDLEAVGGSSDVAIVWGNDRMGLEKIGNKRGVDVVWSVLRAVALGTLDRHSATKKTVVLKYQNARAVLSLDEKGERKTWLLTGWEEGRPDVPAEVRAPSGTTQHAPTFSRDVLGAGLETNLALSDDQRNTYQQAAKDDDTKGSITFGPQGINIKLMAKADLSTFIHESGHLYLNELLEDAKALDEIPVEQRTPVQVQLLADVATINSWLGNKDDGKRITVEQHEKFARGFEAYAMEGKAPSQAMRTIFSAFRRWLINVYRSLTTAPLNVKLTNPVRQVMDRMVATDDEITKAETEGELLPLFTTAESAGMTEAQFANYKTHVAEASLAAREALQKKLMAQYQRTNETWWKEERARRVETITTQVNDQNEYVALAVLQTGKFPDGSPLAEGVEPMKLDRKAIKAQFGRDFLKQMPKGTTANGGMHPDVAAGLFGYNTGQHLIMAIINARPKNQLIEAEADRQMAQEHGDLLTDGTIAEEARAAVINSHQEQVIAAEIRALNAKQREVRPFVKQAEAEGKAAQKEATDALKAEAKEKAAKARATETAGKQLLRTIIPTLEETRELARGILARMALKNVNPHQYLVQARQASKNATSALASNEYLDAGKFKQRELLNLALYREAKEVKEQMIRAHDLFGDFFKADSTLAKLRNMDLVNVGRAILAQYGLARPTEKTAAEYLKPIQTYDVDLYNQWKPQVDALAPRPLQFYALTVEEATKVHDDLRALWHLSRRTKQILINGEFRERADVVRLLSVILGDFTQAQRDQMVGRQTQWADMKVGLLSWRSALRRVESWVDAMDSGRQDGLFRSFIWTPISEASTTFRASKSAMLQQYLELIKPIEATMTRDLIAAPELGPGVAFRGKGALVHALLHTGNDSNQSKLLRGYRWEPATWQRFLDRATRDGLITKADYDFVQGVWDLLETVKPLAQKAHHDMYGYYFNEITARPVHTPFGDYRGGYVPAIADRNLSVDQAIREEKDLFDQAGNSFMFPTTGRGFTKGRIEEYAAPLALDLTGIPVHLDKILRFVHLEPTVKDIARLVTNRQLRQALDAMDPTAAKDMLVPWLQRSAQQTVSTPGRNRHADQLFRYLRKATSAQIMVGNVINALQQLSGFSSTLLKVRTRYLRGSLVNYLRHPVQYAEDVASKSAFMKGRTATQVIEIQSTIDDLLLNPSQYDKARRFADKHGFFLQQGTQNLVDLITWGAAYDEASGQHMTDKEAVRVADAAVRQTQGSFAPEDLSAFESGTPFTRAFTMFYSYFNMQANLLGTEFQKVARDMGLRKGAGRALYIYVVGFMIPAVMAEGVVRAMGGFDPDDDDDYLNEALSLFFGSQIRAAAAYFPAVGPITLAGINAFNDKWYDDRISTSPVVSLLESAVQAPHSLYKAMSEDGRSKKAVRDVLSLIGLVTGLPVGVLIRPGGYLADVADGVANPKDAVDVTRGLLSGKDVNRTK